jgi:hypothetical protein
MCLLVTNGYNFNELPAVIKTVSLSIFIRVAEPHLVNAAPAPVEKTVKIVKKNYKSIRFLAQKGNYLVINTEQYFPEARSSHPSSSFFPESSVAI